MINFGLIMMNPSNSNSNYITQRGEIARQQLIEAAMELFAENGIEGASTRQIANKAKQNIGAIAYYFNSKEGLYMAVANWIAEFIKHNFKDIFEETERFLASGAASDSADQCLNQIKKIIRLQCILLTKPETINLSKILLREQLSPSAAFQLIHGQSLAPLHFNLTRLVAAYIGVSEYCQKTILHTHAIIGEVLSFRVGRETMLMRVGWEKIDDPEVSIIEGVLFEHVELILRGLRAKQIKD